MQYVDVKTEEKVVTRFMPKVENLGSYHTCQVCWVKDRDVPLVAAFYTSAEVPHQEGTHRRGVQVCEQCVTALAGVFKENQ